MKYYSKIIFRILIGIHILALFVILLYWYTFFTLACWMAKSLDECIKLKAEMSVFFGIIPMLFVVLSGLIIVLQQRGRKRIGYFIIPLALIPSFYIGYLLWYATSWYNIKAWFSAWIFSDFFHLVAGLILFAVALIPLYVLIKLIKEDFFKNRRGAK